MKRKNVFLTRTVLILMAVMMILTAWVFVAPEKAEAATAGDYRIFIGIQVTNGSGSEHEDELYVKVTYDKKDGSGSAQTGDLLDHSQCWGPDSWSNHYANIDTTIPGFPTRVDVCVNMKGVGFAWADTDALTIYVQSIKVYNYKTNAWVTFWEGSVKFDSERNEYRAHWDRDGHHNDNRTSREWETYTPYQSNWDTKPYAESITAISGNDSVNVSTTNSTVTKSYSLGTVKDQYGVNWREDASWDTATVSNGVTFSNGTLTVPASSNRANDYTVTLKEKCGSITKTKTVTIKTFDYKVTFYDENGTTVLKAEQTVDYGGSATAPNNPTKASDSSKHYTFSSWTGDGYTNITSGAQIKTVKASYTGAAHNPSGWQTDANQHWKECTSCHYITTAKANHSYGSWSTNTATCTAGGSHYRDCSCGYRQTENTSQLGHNFTSQITSSTYLKSAATCTESAVYYYKCSRCSEKGTTTFTSGNALGHDYGTASYTWANDGSSCSAQRICSRDGSHKETENATISSAVKTASTCSTKGTTRYTATFSNSAFSSKTKDVQDIAKNPSNHEATENRAAVAATCTTAGYTAGTYCTACDNWTSGHATVAALGHDDTSQVQSSTYLKSAANCVDKAVYYYKCSRCDHKGLGTYEYGSVSPSNHKTTENRAAVAATCTTGGYTAGVYCTACNKWASGHASIDALGHNYGAATYSWASDFSTCTGTRVCSRNSSHTDPATATITSVTTEPTYSNNGVRTYTATFNKAGFSNQNETESIPALSTLITVPTVVNELDSNTGRVSFALTSTPKSEVTYQVMGLVEGTVSDVEADKLKSESTKPTVKNSIGGHQGTISIEDGTIRYELTKMTFTQVEEFYALVKVQGTSDYKYSDNTVYTYEKVTIVPSQTVLFDDEFTGITGISFGPNGKWTTTNSSTVNNAGDGAGQVTENEGDSVLYSLGSIHKVNVSAADAASWPTAEFTFTGTGFDLISVTSNDSGVFSYSIYDAETNTYAVDSNGKRYAKNKLVDTYYGYTYGNLYWNAATRKIVGSGGAPLYVAKSNCPDDKKIETGNGNFIYTTELDCAVSSTQAKGWLEATSGVNGLYQIPVISRNDLPYGTYKVVVTAMYNQNFAHNNSKSYNLYIDGVRIYNPAQGNEIAQTKYNTDGESNPVYTSFRNALNDGYVIAIDGGNKLYEDGADNNGIDKNTMSLEAYLKGSPNNELYLLPGGTITFSINGNAYEAIKIGAKSVDGSATTMGVAFGNGSRSFSVNTATEKYYSVKDLIDDSNGTVTITNSGSGILSLTKLMTSVKPSQANHAPARIMSVSESTFDEALELLEMTEADIAIDEETVETASGDDGTVTITLQTGEDAETIVIRDSDGNVVEPDSIEFTIDEEGIKNWTIVMTEESEGEFTFTLQAEYENGYTGNAEPTTVTVTVSFPEPEDTSIGGRLDKIKGFFERLIEFIRRIIKLFR